jgi:glycosyltransferase involved in cell wall biosynthesis
MEQRIKILNVLPLGGIGGAEQFVRSLCLHHNSKRFENHVCVLFSQGAISNQIATAGFYVRILDMASGFDFFRAMHLVSIIKNRQIDIVNIHGQNPLGKFFSVLSRARVIIHTDHGTTIGSPVKRKKRIVIFNRLMSPFIHHFIAISQGMRQSLRLREKIRDDKISLIYNGVDVDAIAGMTTKRAALRKGLNLPDAIPVLGTVGRLAQEKQIPLLLESLAVLKNQSVRFLALIVGDGPDMDALQSLARKMKLNRQVRFLGQRDDVPQILDIMDIFIFSSGGEAFSITLLEAMAKAKPIVAFNVQGVNEAVVNYQTGFMVPFGDVNGFAQKTKYLIESPDLARKMGRSGLERVRAQFNLISNIRKLERLYETLMANTKVR